MAKKFLNEAEQLLLKNWLDAMELQEAMDEVRLKYEAACQKVLDAVKENHPDLDLDDNRVNRTTGPNKGSIYLGRKKWPGNKRYPIGLYVENLRLDQLSNDESPDPITSLWIGAGDEADLERRVMVVRQMVLEAMVAVFSGDERARIVKGPDEDYVACIVTPKASVIEKLLEDGSQPFIDYVASNLEVIAKLLPVLDEAFDRQVGD